MFDLSFCRHFLARWRCLITCATVLLFTFSSNAYPHGVTFKYRDAEPANSAFSTNFLQAWAAKLHEDSRGRINLLMVPQDAASANADLLRTLMERNADIVWLNLQSPAAAYPRFMVFGTALEGATSEGSSQALWSWVDANDLAFREFKDMRVLAAVRHDVPLFHMREHALSSLSDLKGAKIAIPTSEAETFLSELGASPLVVPEANIPEALAQNGVDGVLLSWSSYATLNLETLVKAHSEAPRGAPWPYAELSVLLMNSEAYRGLADDLRQTISANSGNDVSALIGKTMDAAAQTARKRAGEHGDTLNTLPESDLGKWRKAANATINKHIAALDAIGLKGEKIIAKARALILEYDSAR